MANRKRKKEVEISTVNTNELRSMFDRGLFATVNFTKKGDGSNRTLNGKLSVRSALRGGEASYDAESRGQLRIADVNLRDENGNRYSGFRAVTAKNVNWITSKGIKYIVVDGGKPLTNFVRKIDYLASARVLMLQLTDRKYIYKNVPANVAEGMKSAENKGSYFNTFIKGTYDFEVVK